MNTSAEQTLLKRVIPFIICALASCFYFYEFFLRVTPSAITHELMHEFGMDAKALGLMSALFYYGYTPMQIPAGLLLDRFGARFLMTIAMALCAGGAFLFSIADTSLMLALGRFMMGFASAFAFVGVLVLAAHWFPRQYFAFIAGVVQLMGCVGAIIGEAPVAFLSDHIGWRITLLWASGVGLLLAGLFWLIIRDAPEGQSIETIQSSDSGALTQEWERLCYICSNPQTWFVGIAGFACWAPAVTFASLWGIPFLMVDYHTNAATASIAAAVIWIGVAISSPLIGWWSDKIGSRRIPLLVAASLGLLSSLGVIYIHHPPWWVMNGLLFLFGSAAAAQSVTFGLVQDNNPASVEGTAIGFNNMAVIFGGMTVQPVVGLLLKYMWDGRLSHGVPVYSFGAYGKALFLLPVCSLALMVVSFFIKETYCRPQYR